MDFFFSGRGKGREKAETAVQALSLSSPIQTSLSPTHPAPSKQNNKTKHGSPFPGESVRASLKSSQQPVWVFPGLVGGGCNHELGGGGSLSGLLRVL